MKFISQKISDKPLRSIAYGNGVYVIVGDGGFIATSKDSINWIEVDSIAKADNKKLYDIIYNEDIKKFIAVGEHMLILFSDDGETWVKNYGYDTSYNKRIISVIYDYNESKTIAYWMYGATPWIKGCIYSSNGGENWTNVSFGETGTQGNDVILYRNLFIVASLGFSSHNISGGIRTSTTGIGTFTNRYGNFSFNGVAKNNNESLALAVGEGGRIAISENGINWIGVNSNTDKTLYSATFFKDAFVVAGSEGVVLKSTDGTSWENVEFGNDTINKVKNCNGRLYILDTQGSIHKYIIENYLIRQKENLYYIDHNYLNLGASTDVNKTNQWLDNYSYDDIEILMESLNYKKTPTDKGFEEIYKSLNIDFKDIKGDISLKNEDEKKNIYYDCEEYKIIDKVRENNNGLGNIVYKKY